MQLRYTQVLAGMRQMQRYLDANGVILGDLNSGGGRAEFDRVTARLGTLAEKQDAHRMNASGELSNERKHARALRRKHMRPVVQVARSKVPAAAQLSAVSLPPIRSNSTDTATRARAMAAAVEPYRQLLHEGGLPADFVEQLVAAASALETAVSAKRTHQVGRVGSTANIDAEVAETRLQVSAMDALVRATVGEHEPKLDEWAKIVRDIRSALRQATKPAVVGQPGGSTPPVTPATPATPTTEAATPVERGLKLAA